MAHVAAYEPTQHASSVRFCLADGAYFVKFDMVITKIGTAFLLRAATDNLQRLSAFWMVKMHQVHANIRFRFVFCNWPHVNYWCFIIT